MDPLAALLAALLIFWLVVALGLLARKVITKAKIDAFREFVLGLVETMLIFYIVVATVGGGWYVWKLCAPSIEMSMQDWSASQRWMLELVIALLGCIIGLFLSAASALLVFLLMELTATIRTIAVRLEDISLALSALPTRDPDAAP